MKTLTERPREPNTVYRFLRRISDALARRSSRVEHQAPETEVSLFTADYRHIYLRSAKPTFESPAPLEQKLPALPSNLPLYTYADLLALQESKEPPGEPFIPEHLEMHLHEEDLLDRIGVCRGILPSLDPMDLHDRKYAAGLTAEQFLASCQWNRS
jgi:hypothetical protein